MSCNAHGADSSDRATKAAMMLCSLSIRNFLLVEALEVEFGAGLSTLTGETGAGKSILLDALGLALGQRGTNGLVRLGVAQAVISARFRIAPEQAAYQILAEQGLAPDPAEDDPDSLILRRVMSPDGRSRAFVNDQPVTIGILRQIGETLVEIHGQHDTHGLLDPQNHRSLLDAFANHGDVLLETGQLWQAWQAADRACETAQAEAEQARREEDFLRHALAEINELAPQAGECENLARQRALLMHHEKLTAAANEVEALLQGDQGAESALNQALAVLERVRALAEGRLDASIAALDRSLAELSEASHSLHEMMHQMGEAEAPLEDIEERLFTLRAIARKHGIEADDLPRFAEDLARRVALIEDQGACVEKLAQAARRARADYIKVAEKLTDSRQSAASALRERISVELPDLKLDKVRLEIAVTALEEQQWGAKGQDRIRFLVATNPGAEPAALEKVASGGELARLMLAFKLVLQKASPVPTLVFDEVDTGIGGATAAAVGQRLAQLGQIAQVLTVTHSPQVAARGQHHWRVEKEETGTDTPPRTLLIPLDVTARREEIARMLSGQNITAEARAQADQLLAVG